MNCSVLGFRVELGFGAEFEKFQVFLFFDESVF